jgi:hypothetical protein
MVPGTNGNRSYDFRLPPSLCFGAAYEFSQEWLAASDVSMVFWNKAINYGVPVGDFKAINVAFGGQYIPAPNLLAPRYWEIIHYRAGFRYTQLQDPDAHETMLSLGVGLPVGGRSGIFDLTLEAGKRVDSKYPNLGENVFHIALGFNSGRKWSKSSRGNY